MIEPAIMGIPVLFGPIHKNSFEALELLRYGAAIEVKCAADVEASSDRSSATARSEKRWANAPAVSSSRSSARRQRCYEAIREYL